MTPAPSTNHSLQPWVRIAVLAAILVQLIGVGLLLAPEAVMPRWPWKVPQFNARFMGAIYLGQAAASLPLLFINRWSPGRAALLAAFLFTAIASVGSILHWDEFVGGRRTPLWFALYIGYAGLTGYALWSNRNLAAPPAVAADETTKRVVAAVGWSMVAYGAALFALPGIAAAFWPWPVNAMHGSIYSAVFAAAGAAAVLTARKGATEEWLSVAIFLTVFGAGAILGLVLADMATSRVDWTALGTLVWLAMFAGLAATGALAGKAALEAR